MKTNEMCSCGCDTRGMISYQLSGYRKNYDQKSFETYNQETKTNEMVTIDAHLNNNEHVVAWDLGYFDNNDEGKELAIKKAREISWKHEKESLSLVEWYEVWGNDTKVFTDCMHPRMESGTEMSDRGSEFDWYYCDDCGFDQVS